MNITRLRKAARAITALAVIASTAVGIIHAACWDTGTTPKPSSQYVVQSSTGTVVDSATGLMWKHCGQGLSGTTCATGTASGMTWDTGSATASSNTFAGYNDWRLPTLTELQSLLPSDCSFPKINTNVFPGVPTLSFSFFWSGTPHSGGATDARVVDFNSGIVPYSSRASANFVRLVRAGEAFGISAPTLQTLTFSAAPALPFGGTAVVAAASAVPNSGNPVVYASTTPAVCSVDASSGMVSVANAAVVGDTCTISANQFGRAYSGQNYAQAAQVTQSINVSQGAQSVAFGIAPAVTVSGAGVVTATSNQSLTPVIFGSITPGTCTVSGTNGSTVTGVTVGTCTIQASQLGNSTYNAAITNLSFSVGPAAVVCNLHMDGVNPLLASVEGLILTRAMLGIRGSAVTVGTGIATPWETIRSDLNAKCGTAFLP